MQELIVILAVLGALAYFFFRLKSKKKKKGCEDCH